MISAGKLASALGAFATCLSAYASPILYTGGNYSENFDSLPWVPSNTVIAAWVDDSILPGWYASGAYYLRGSNGYPTSQANTAVFSYSSTRVDNAFGTQNGFAWAANVALRFGVQLINDTGTPLSRFTLSYFGEQWRDGGNNQVEQLSFDYAVNAQSLTSGNYVGVGDLSFQSPIYSPNIAALDGNLSANRMALTAAIADINWAPGESLWLRWTDVDDPGSHSNSALAIDDLVFTASAFVASPVETALAGVVTPPGPLSISEPSTGWLTGLCIAALAIVTRCPKKHSAKTEAVARALTQ